MHHHLHGVAAAGYIPVIHKKPGKNEGTEKTHWILSSREIRSLIVSALIFLTVFAWVDVIASTYREHIFNKNRMGPRNAGMMPPRFPHHVPQSLTSRTEDLDLKAKIGYASILSMVAVSAFFLLSLCFPSLKLSPTNNRSGRDLL